jgi:uridine kinase
VVIPQDSYYKDSSHVPEEERKNINFDHPDAIDWKLMCQQIRELKSGKSIEQPIYSYITCSRSSETITVEPDDVVIVEGILIFTCKELRDQMNIKIFVDADGDDRLMRIIVRDIAERGRTIETAIEHYCNTVKPMHLQFIEPSKRYADVIVPQGGHNKVAIDIITNTVEKALSQKKKKAKHKK